MGSDTWLEGGDDEWLEGKGEAGTWGRSSPVMLPFRYSKVDDIDGRAENCSERLLRVVVRSASVASREVLRDSRPA